MCVLLFAHTQIRVDSCILSILVLAGYLRHETYRREGILAVPNLLIHSLSKWLMETLLPLHFHLDTMVSFWGSDVITSCWKRTADYFQLSQTFSKCQKQKESTDWGDSWLKMCSSLNTFTSPPPQLSHTLTCTHTHDTWSMAIYSQSKPDNKISGSLWLHMVEQQLQTLKTHTHKHTG